MSDQDPPKELDETELNELIGQLELEERDLVESTLASISSFQLWIDSHPAMRQMLIVEKVSDIVPAVWKFLRIMFGLERAPAGTDEEQ